MSILNWKVKHPEVLFMFILVMTFLTFAFGFKVAIGWWLIDIFNQTYLRRNP